MDLLHLDILLRIPVSGSVSLSSLLVRSSDAASDHPLAIHVTIPGYRFPKSILLRSVIP